ncbi:peroxisome biogenesis protein 3-1-like isoform X1 [Carex littledalei]|uniref:Peroxisome biogenesis protein 3-1-like isoform X1 n=1 Tax=Carex littledalei TaxID=544730 RepID=A0A833RMM6_9POAL|nr:peroxisome biogenesis protein 3-1-like isoform X1 [Carex littledalei]
MLSLLEKTKFTIEIPNILHTIPILIQQVPKLHIDINHRQFEHYPFRDFDWAKARQAMMLETLFDNIQRISDTITLPYAMHFLRDRVSEKLDLTYFMEKLMQTKGESSFQAHRERFELWEKVKVLSFTRAATSLWTMTMLTLYARVQVNILGRHLYFEMTRSDGSQLLGEESDALSKIEKQEYLATADFLSTYGLNSLIMNMRNAVSQVMKTKQLNSQFSMETVQETMMEILDLFMGVESDLVLINWVDYILPETAAQYREMMSAANADDSSSLLMDFTKLEQLISETREVLSSSDFSTVVEISLRKGVDLLVEEMKVAQGSEAIPLAKLLPRVAQLSTPLLEEPTNNKFIQLLKIAPEVQLFYTFLYADIPRV